MTSPTVSTTLATPIPETRVTGLVFDDQNGDGKQGAEEAGVANVPLVVNEQIVGVTNAQGAFDLNLPAGKPAHLSIIPPKGWSWSGEPVGVQSSASVAIPLRKEAKLLPAQNTATKVTGGAIILGLLGCLAFVGVAVVAQSAATRSLEKTYRRLKSRELEHAMGQELSEHLEALRGGLEGKDAWREIARRLLVEAGKADYSVVLSHVENTSEAPPCFTVVGSDGTEYLFTTDPRVARGEVSHVRRDRVTPLDSAVSPYARVEAHTLWAHLTGQKAPATALSRNTPWYLVSDDSTWGWAEIGGRLSWARKLFRGLAKDR